MTDIDVKRARAEAALSEDLKYTECNYGHDAMVLMHRSVARDLANDAVSLIVEVKRLTKGQEGLADAYLFEQKRADDLTAELTHLRSHYDRAAPEHDLLALLDLYKEREEEAVDFMDAAQAAIVDPCIEHTELNGHIETCEELRDWLSSEAFDGETGGKLADYIKSLGIVVDQFDKQRRRANWHEAGYKAGKQKAIESAVAKLTQQPPFYREMWQALAMELQVLNKPDMQAAMLERIAELKKAGAK